MFPNNDGKPSNKMPPHQSRPTNSTTSKHSILNSFHSSIDKIAGDLTKTLDNFFLGEENIQNRQHISTNPKLQETACKIANKRNMSAGEVDIFSSSLIEVLQDISNDIGNAGRAITSNALNLMHDSVEKIPLSFAENARKEFSSTNLVEMEPCEFELSVDKPSTDECNNGLEFEGNSLIRASIHNDISDDILVSSASEDSMLVYSKGRYKITLDSSNAPYGEEGEDDMVLQSPVFCKEHDEGRPFEKVQDMSIPLHQHDEESGLTEEHMSNNDDDDGDDEGGVTV